MQNIPDIGRKKAKLILESFGSLISIFFPDINKFASIKGIGKKTANHITRLIHS